jgi:hypothetical protein
LWRSARAQGAKSAEASSGTDLFQIEPQKSAVDQDHRASDVTRPR